MKRLLWIFFCIVVLGLKTTQAQVLNDNIESRRILITEETAFSTTIACTVQKSCVDESLTGKCVEYHNDQWFEFSPEVSGQYFVNISGQACRDTRGVQLVVLTGKPCEPATYNIISCTSLASQDDIFVPLEALRAGQPHLLNVDGYLNDQCQFKIAVSTKPNGIPAISPPVIPAGIAAKNGTVFLKWTLPDSLDAASFRVFRREAAAFRMEEIGRVAIIRDSYGKILQEYTFQDSLARPGRYLYQIVAYGTKNDVPVLIKQEWSDLRKKADTPKWYQIPLEKYPDGSELSIVISDAASGTVLRKAQIVKNKKRPEQSRLLVNEWLALGVKKIRIEIQARRKGKTVSGSNFLVDLND